MCDSWFKVLTASRLVLDVGAEMYFKLKVPPMRCDSLLWWRKNWPQNFFRKLYNPGVKRIRTDFLMVGVNEMFACSGFQMCSAANLLARWPKGKNRTCPTSNLTSMVYSCCTCCCAYPFLSNHLKSRNLGPGVTDQLWLEWSHSEKIARCHMDLFEKNIQKYNVATHGKH